MSDIAPAHEALARGDVTIAFGEAAVALQDHEACTTDGVAALLALDLALGVHCEYTGRAANAKEFETTPCRLRWAER